MFPSNHVLGINYLCLPRAENKIKSLLLVKLGMNKRENAGEESSHNEQGSMQAFLAVRPKGEWYSSLITNPPVSDFPPAMLY